MKRYVTFIKFDDLSKEELFNCFTEDIESKEKKIVVTPNLDGLRLAYKKEEIRKCFNQADYSTIDGVPVLKLAKKDNKGVSIQKISGSDMIVDLLPIANQRSWSITLFGGKEGVGKLAKERILEQYPNIRINSVICPAFGFEKDQTLVNKYIDMINNANSDIVLLCVGFPKAELFYFKNQLKFGGGLYFCVGATIDFIAGVKKRAPSWMQKAGLEWLYRLFSDFGRLFKRYWLDGWFLIKLRFIRIFNKKKIERLKSEAVL